VVFILLDESLMENWLHIAASLLPLAVSGNPNQIDRAQFTFRKGELV